MRFIREFLETLLMAVIIYAVLQSTVQTFKVYGASMEPGLQDGQYLIVNKAVFLRVRGNYLFHAPRRGEIVVFHPPRSPELVFIKRVIGLPGDTVEVRGAQVLVNGEPLSEPYLLEPVRYTMPPRVVPAGQYFVLGDNRNRSTDSHRWEEVGPIPAANIIGKASLALWPPRDWGWVPNYSFAR